MPELEDRVRAAFASLDPPEAAGARIRDAALASLDGAFSRRAVRWTRRVLRPLPAIAAAVLVAAIAVVLFLAAPSDRPAAPPDTTGVEMVVRAVPPAANERLADVLRRRGELRGISGMTVAVADGVVHVFVPRTHDVRWPTGLLTGLDVAIYDTATSLIAEGRRLQPVVDALPKPASGDAARFYAVAGTDRPGGGFLAGPFGDEVEAAAAPPPPGLREKVRVVAVPAGTALVVRDDGTYAALRDPIVTPGSITDVVGGDRELRIRVAADRRERTGAAVAAVAPGRRLVVTYGGGGEVPQTVAALRYVGYDAGHGELVFTIEGTSYLSRPAETLAERLAPGGVDAAVTLVSSRAVGPPPARRGDVVPPEEVPSQLRHVARPETVRRVVTAARAGRSLAVWTFVNPAGTELVWAAGAVGGCPIAPDHPAVRACLGGSGPGGWTAVGRVGDAVTTVTAEYAGGSADQAAVANGWFAILGSRDHPARLVARDASGRVVGTDEDIAMFAR